MNVTGKHTATRITYIPLYIHPTTYLPLTRWELLPGLWLEKISNKLKEKIKKIDKPTHKVVWEHPDYAVRIYNHKFPKLTFNPNYAVRINDDKYTKGLEKRLKEEGKKIPDIPKDFEKVYHESIHLAKLILISLVLQQKFIFTLGHAYHFIENEIKSRKTYHYYGHMVIGKDYRTEGVSIMAQALPLRGIKKINRNKLSRTITSLERYYRPYTWEADRLSVALTNLWYALTNINIDQAFLNFTIILEALLSTEKHEITHMLSERAAALLGRTPKQRMDIYYKVRVGAKIKWQL